MALATLGLMILDRAKLTEVLGVEVRLVRGVRGVTHDSRRVEPGFAFVAVPGFKRDGTEFAPEAVRRGASLVVAERDVPGVPTAVVGDARGSLAVLAREVNGDPSRSMRVYGVTGTNGKTTTSYVLHAILAGAHGEGGCGLMTTAETVSGGERRPAVRTTPEATEVQGTLAAMLGAGVRRVVMEVSSHGLALKRVAGTRFAGAIFTNLTRDHLDLHGSMEAYYAAKRELFHMTEGPEARQRRRRLRKAARRGTRRRQHLRERGRRGLQGRRGRDDAGRDGLRSAPPGRRSRASDAAARALQRAQRRRGSLARARHRDG